MDRRRSTKSNKKSTRNSSVPKKINCLLCKNRPSNALIISHSLYKKYPSTQNHYYIVQFESITEKLSQENSTVESED